MANAGVPIAPSPIEYMHGARSRARQGENARKITKTNTKTKKKIVTKKRVIVKHPLPRERSGNGTRARAYLHRVGELKFAAQ